MKTISASQLIQKGVVLSVALIMLLSLVSVPVQADDEDYVFEAGVEFCDPATGLAVINGVDTRAPSKPFTFDWGDGTVEPAWFVAEHTYEETSQTYLVTITSAAGGETTLTVDFANCPALEIQAWTDEINPETGYVRVNGFVRGSPLVRVEWGDGSDPTESFFPFEHYYADTSQDYVITVTGVFYDGSEGTTTLPVSFVQPDQHRIEVWTALTPYRIFGFGWDFDTLVTITVDDPSSGETFLSDTVSPAPASWDVGYPLIEYEVGGGILLAGRRVTLDDGNSSRELIISDVAVTLVNVLTDRVDGTALPGTRIETWFCNEDCAFRWMVVGEDGTWFADFATPMGTGVPEEDATVEITPYNYSTVDVRDDDDDKTVVHWVGLMPIVEANLTDNIIWTYDWTIGGSVVLTIEQGGEVVHTDTQALEHPEWNPDTFVARFELGDFTLAPGQVVTVRNVDADMEKTLAIVDLQVTRVDVGADTIEGYAPPGTVVDTSYLCDDVDCAWRLSTADETGYWKADYGQPSGLNNGDQAFENTFDILPGFANNARVFDDDRDNTTLMWVAPNFNLRIEAWNWDQSGDDYVLGYGWPLGQPVTLFVDGAAFGDPLYPAAADWNPEETVVRFNLLSELQLTGGQVLVLTNGDLEKSMTVSDMLVTNVDVVTDQVSGTAAAGTRVETNWCSDMGQYCAMRRVIADENNQWLADFAQPAGTGVPEEEVVMDILPYVVSIAQVWEDDGDVTNVSWFGHAPVGGESTGEGWIVSPVGSYRLDPSAGGKANFSFTAKYPKKSATPVGTLEFRFAAGSLIFTSTEIHWVVIAGNKVQARGVGVLNGRGNYWFLLTAFDNGSGGKNDQFRLQIVDDLSAKIVYDNLLNPPVNPTPLLGGGNIIVRTR